MTETILSQEMFTFINAIVVSKASSSILIVFLRKSSNVPDAWKLTPLVLGLKVFNEPTKEF